MEEEAQKRLARYQFKKGDPRINRNGPPTKEKLVKAAHFRQRAVGLMMNGMLSQAKVAKAMGVTTQTLVKYLGPDLKAAKEAAMGRVATGILDLALNGKDEAVKLNAQKFILERRAGWTPVVRNEHSGIDGGAIEVIDMSQFTLEELEAIDVMQKQKLLDATAQIVDVTAQAVEGTTIDGATVEDQKVSQ